MEVKQDSFKTQIIGLGRITISAKTREYLKLKTGDWVEVIIKKVI